MEKVKKDDIVTALAVYSSRVSACIAVLDKENRPNIAGLGKSEGKLMGAKGIFDIDALSKAIRDALKAAQEEAKLECPRTFVSISGGNIGSENARGMINLGQRGEEISEKNVIGVLKMADTIPLNIEREIIHSVPQDFAVDGQHGIENPVGLYGVKLEAETLLVTIHIPFLQNVIKCLNLAGIELEDVVFSGIAASKSLLSHEDAKGKGALLIEIDDNFTAASVFFDGTLKGLDIRQRSVIAEGTLETLKEKINKIRGNRPISKIILAGGSFIHEDFIEKVDSIFGIPSHMAYARDIKGSAGDINNPANLTAIGATLYGFEERKKGLSAKKDGVGLLSKTTKKINDFLNEYF